VIESCDAFIILNDRDLTFSSYRVKIFVNILRDGNDLRIKLRFNIEQILLIRVSDEVDCKTQMTKTTGSTNSVKIGLCISWEVKIDDDVNGEDINTSGKNVRTNQAPCLTIFVVVVDSKQRRNIRIKSSKNKLLTCYGLLVASLSGCRNKSSPSMQSSWPGARPSLHSRRK